MKPWGPQARREFP